MEGTVENTIMNRKLVTLIIDRSGDAFRAGSGHKLAFSR